jgi:acetolactate synthase-1/2/3 large subunit
VAYPGSTGAARDPEGHLWLQQTFDQNGIVRNTPWDHHLELRTIPA